MTEKTLPVIEIFGPTIQGEGPAIGQTVAFIRFAYCGYRCDWCDSMHAVEPKKENVRKMTAIEILDEVLALHLPYTTPIVLSGGDPAMQDLAELIHLLRLQGHPVHAETQGARTSPWFPELDLLVISPKPPSSGMHTRINMDLLKTIRRTQRSRSRGETAWKVAVFNEADLLWAEQVSFALELPFMYLSVGTLPSDTTAHVLARMTALYVQSVEVLSPHFRHTLLPQLHVLLWGHAKGV